jgi:hypothetical protein
VTGSRVFIDALRVYAGWPPPPVAPKIWPVEKLSAGSAAKSMVPALLVDIASTKW